MIGRPACTSPPGSAAPKLRPQQRKHRTNMFPSRPSDIKPPTLSSTLKLSDSRRHCRLCSGTTPFFRRLSRASCSGSGRSVPPLSAAVCRRRGWTQNRCGLRVSGCRGYSGKWSMSETAGRLRPRHGQPGVPPEGPAHRSPQPGRGRSVRSSGGGGGGKLSRKITAPASLSSYNSKNQTLPDVDSCWNVSLPQIIRV